MMLFFVSNMPKSSLQESCESAALATETPLFSVISTLLKGNKPQQRRDERAEEQKLLVELASDGFVPVLLFLSLLE